MKVVLGTYILHMSARIYVKTPKFDRVMLALLTHEQLFVHAQHEPTQHAVQSTPPAKGFKQILIPSTTEPSHQPQLQRDIPMSIRKSQPTTSLLYHPWKCIISHMRAGPRHSRERDC